jgi:hypothetical protein
MTRKSRILLLAGILLAGISSAPAQTAKESCWKYSVTPYFWAIATDGDIGVGPITIPIDQSFSEAWDRLDFGAMLAFEANKDKWMVFLSASYIDIDDTASTPFGNIRAEVEQIIAQAAVGYRLVAEPKLDLDAGLGGRYLFSELDVILPVDRPDISRSLDWVDPVVFARATLKFTDRCYGVLSGDIGGFGIASDLTAQVYALAGYSFNETFSLLLGYRYLYYDYEDGGISYDVVQDGLMTGLQIRF